MHTIYCDEAGFTGNQLLDDEQPYFAFAAIRIDSASAASYQRELLKQLPANTRELKGGKLCKSAKGRRVVEKTLAEMSANASVVVFHKRYSLACKAFEYLIEPALSRVSSALYDRDFHKFVSNTAYAQMVADEVSCDRFFARFQNAISGRSAERLAEASGSSMIEVAGDFLSHVDTFSACNHDRIAYEVNDANPGRGGGWLLELTTTGAYSALRELGKDMTPMQVYCDQSKPLHDSRIFLDSMIDREEKAFASHAGRVHQLTFNLACPVQLVDSAQHPGVQLADILASCSVFALKNPNSELATTWRSCCEEFLHADSVFPDIDYLDFNSIKTRTNMHIFAGLLQCSLEGGDCEAELPSIIQAAEFRASNEQS